MAYPTVSAPYGFQPINRIDGMPYAGATRLIPIASAYNTAIYNGDLVKIVADGTCEKFTGTTTGGTVGVCVGVQYVNSLSQFTPAQYYPGTSVTDAYAIVVDDPMAAFKVAVTNGSSVISSAARASVAANMSVIQGTGNAATGDSGQSILAASEGATATLPIRVIDVVTETSTAADTYVELVVKLNTHQYNNTTGV
tara:strand:+ start:2249 stop:2836 length:588 start_codon:yes stop_codon:yes gene_type:complete